MTVYGSLAVANTVFTAARAFLFAYGAIHAATVIHRRLLDSVLKVICKKKKKKKCFVNNREQIKQDYANISECRTIMPNFR